MEKIAEEFPLPILQHAEHSGEGEWDDSDLEDLLRAIKEVYEDDFEYEKTPRRDGWQVTCPGNRDGGWPDGREHGEKYGHVNDSSIVYVEDGWACFSCKHNACYDGNALGKKTFKDFINFWAPDYDISDCFDVEELVLEPEYRYSIIFEDPKGRIYSNNGKTWYDANDTKV